MLRMMRRFALAALSGAVVASGASVAKAQSGPQLPVVPVVAQTAPAPRPILPVTAQEPRPEMPALPGAIRTPVVPVSADSSSDDLKARIDRLEKQNQDLLKALGGIRSQSPQTPISSEVGGALNKEDVQKIVGDYLNNKAAQEKAAADAAKLEQQERGFVVGKSTTPVPTVSPTNGQFWLETPDKAFRLHFGGRVQYDVIFGASGSGSDIEQGIGGTGPFLEGGNFRRARLAADGWLYENFDFMVEFDWANTPFNTGVGQRNKTLAGTQTGTQPFNNIANLPAPTDVWAGINFLPGIGSIRVGSLKPPIGLDHLTSSRYLDFLERSSGFDTYYNRNNGFEPGFMVFNNNAAQTITWALSATKTANSGLGFDQGGGLWSYTGRITWLPYYEDNGRRMIHLGLGGNYRRLDSSTGTPQANLNTRWLLRNSQAGLQNVVSQVNLIGIDQEIINPEFFMNLGPLSIQAEYIASRVNGVTAFNTQLTAVNGNGTVTNTVIPSTTYFSQTAYIQALYFLTGESRPYGKTQLHGSGAAPTRVVPFRNFFWVPGQGCSNPFSAGAWQVGARYCYSDLNNGPINGGIINEVTLGLNWFLNPNLKFQWNYDWGYRDLSAGGGTSNGSYQGFGMRMAFDF